MHAQHRETEVRAAVERCGLRPDQLRLVSPLGERKGMRYAYRVQTVDGPVIKARHYASAAEAQRVHDLRRPLEHAFAPVLGCFGAVLVEAWVDGEMLSAATEDPWIAPAGALLGRLHALPLATGIEPSCDTRSWSEAAAADIDLLCESAVIDAADATRLRKAIAVCDPGRARAALLHKDFCAENMLVDRQGALRIIDNEQMAIGPSGFDLGWTWHRWPLSPQHWESFLTGYRSAAPDDPAALEYWQLVTGLTLTRVLFQRMPARLDAQLVRLRRCLSAIHGSEAPGP